MSGSDQQLGVVTTPPRSSTRSTTGTPEDTLTIVESLDGVTLNTITPAERNHQYTFALTAGAVRRPHWAAHHDYQGLGQRREQRHPYHHLYPVRLHHRL